MLKSLLLSGWFRTQPFLNYVVVAILIAPLVAASGNSSSAKQSKAIAKTAPESEKPESVPQDIASIGEQNLHEVLILKQIDTPAKAEGSLGQQTVVNKRQKLLAMENKDASLLAAEYAHTHNPLAAVELAPIEEIPASAKITATQVTPTVKKSEPITSPDISVEEPKQEEQAQADPIGSPHPIPWQWILATQEAIGSKGASGTRYYRSVPVVSPDGKYAVYSRVQIEVKPEMYNSKVTSVLFIEDRETKKLRIMAATNVTNDPLLKSQPAVSTETDTEGKIGVLVPVSWSEKSDRFLARKFEGVFNTADSTDRAVIWDRQKNQTNTVSPAQTEYDHEKIAVLLGWSKNEPDHVIFRAGELGEENWPLVKVAVDGKTATTTDTDQPITYGEKLTQVWAGPQVAYR